MEILSRERNKQKELTENTLQSFIHKNFNDDMPDRLKTFEKFAFSNVERDEHKFIKPILSEIKTFKEPHGTMLITDLWSKNLQKECLDKSNMLREKKMLEKYLFYKNKSKKTEKNEHLPLIITKKNEQIVKNEISNKKEMKNQQSSIINKVYLTKFRKINEEKFLHYFILICYIFFFLSNHIIGKKLENILDLIVNLNKENAEDKKYYYFLIFKSYI